MVCLQRNSVDPNLKTNIVCYAGGTCGDLICALIDPTDAVVDKNKIILTNDRSKLKKPHLFSNDVDKDLYILEITKKYQSIPSHDFAYHKTRQHSIIGIVIDKLSTAKIASSRFKKLHRPKVWNEMQKFCGAQTVDDYAQILIDFSNLIASQCDIVVKLENIINGTAILNFEKNGLYISNQGQEIYHRWLALDMFK